MYISGKFTNYYLISGKLVCLYLFSVLNFNYLFFRSVYVFSRIVFFLYFYSGITYNYFPESLLITKYLISGKLVCLYFACIFPTQF